MSKQFAKVNALVRRSFETMKYRPTATGILVDSWDRVVMITHPNNDDGWTLPGGGVRRYEYAERGFLREMQEELGIPEEHLVLDRYLGDVVLEQKACRCQDRFTRGKQFLFFQAYYVGPEQLRPNTREVGQYKWFPKRDIGSYLNPAHTEKRVFLASHGMLQLAA